MRAIRSIFLLSALVPLHSWAVEQTAYIHADFDLIVFKNGPVGGTNGIRFGSGYHFSTNFAVDGGILLISDLIRSHSSLRFAPYTDENLTPTIVQVAMIGFVPLKDDEKLFGELGMANTALEYSYSLYGGGVQPVSGRGSVTKTNPMFGFGWQSAAESGWRLLLKYEQLGQTRLTATYSNGTSKMYDIGIHVFSIGGIHAL